VAALDYPAPAPYCIGMSRDPTLRPGKLPADLLERLLRSRETPGGAVVGPGIGLDGAVLNLRPPARPGEEHDGAPPPFLVAASDPITFTAEEIGWYAVHVNANDVVCMGALPRWFLATVLVPEGTVEADIAEIFDQMDRACEEVGAGLVGGHTEITAGIDRPILVGTMLGVTTHWVSAAGARPGDALLLAGGIAVEGTAILARDAADRLAGRVDDVVLDRARRFLHDPGISVLRPARAALASGAVHALHDPTEGGLAAGIHELCDASGTGARVDLQAVHVFDETRALAGPFGIDPMGLIASGSLLITVPDDDATAVLDELSGQAIHAARIGSIQHAALGVMAVEDGGERPLPRFEADEIGKAFDPG